MDTNTFFTINKNSTKLLSVDIFDTLVFRLVNEPKDIFRELGKRAKDLDMLHHAFTPDEFALLRACAEVDARKAQLKNNDHCEVSLSEIYEFLPASIGNKIELQKLELQVECEFCYINPEIYKGIQNANSQNIPVVLTSDMYLIKNQLEEILIFNDFNLKLIEEIYVSCENECNKVSGKLFERVLKDYPEIKPQEVLHIGDKLGSDIEPAKSLGIQTYHYDVIPNVMKEVCDYEAICLTGPKYFNSIRKLAVHSSLGGNRIENPIGAGILGPAFTLFCNWVLDVCVKESIKNIYPFMREGELFAPMLENSAKKRKLELEITPLYVSRESTWLASLREWNEEECQNLCNRHGIAVKDIFNAIGVDLISEFIPVKDSYFKNLSPNQQRGILDLVNSEETKQSVNEKISKNYDTLNAYLDKAFDENTNFVTVDLGFNGTIVKHVEDVFSKSSKNYSCKHLLAFGSDRIIDLKRNDFDIRSFFTSPGLNQDLLKPIQRSSFPLEQLFITGELGSVLNYEMSDDNIKPITQKTYTTTKSIKIKKSIHASVLNFQNHWYDLYDQKKFILRKPLDCQAERRAICSTLTRMLETPTLQEAQFLGDLTHDLNYGSTKNRLICTKKDFKTLERIGSEKKFLKSSRVNGVHWPQGIVTRSNRYFILKQKLQQSSPDTYLQTMNDIMVSAQLDNFSEIIIYGAGEVGKAAFDAAEINDLKVKCFVDSKKSLWGSEIKETPVFSLRTALNKFFEVPIIIGSFDFLDQIESTIKDTLTEQKRANRIFSAKNLSH